MKNKTHPTFRSPYGQSLLARLAAPELAARAVIKSSPYELRDGVLYIRGTSAMGKTTALASNFLRLRLAQSQQINL